MVRVRGLLRALIVFCLLLSTAAPGRAEEPSPPDPGGVPVDLQLILAVDSSGSINADEFRLQMEGLTAAFRNHAVLEAIRRGPIGAIAVTLIEWASVDQQHQSVAWTRICDEESMAVFARQLGATPGFIPGGSTSVSDALNYSGRMFAKSGFASERRVIDVSGDGSNNSGIP